MLIRYKDKKKILPLVRKQNMRYYNVLVLVLEKCGVSNASELVSGYVNSFNERSLHRGRLDAAQHFKLVYGISLRYAADQLFEPIPFTKSRNGIPLVVLPFLPLLKGSATDRQNALHVLSIFKIVSTRNDNVDYSSITKPDRIPRKHNSKIGPNSYLNRISRFLKENPEEQNKIAVPQFWRSTPQALNELISFKWDQTLIEAFPTDPQSKTLRFLEISEYNKLHVSTSKGPSGPGLVSIPLEYEALVNDQRPRSLLRVITAMADLMSFKDLQDVLNLFLECDSTCVNTTREDSYCFSSRIALKDEPGGKVRTFAIVDYFSQSVLSGFHTWCYQWLYSQAEDGTKSHDSAASTAKEWTKDGTKDIVSADLSKATDSTSSDMQQEIVSMIAGRKFGLYWHLVLTDRAFVTPDFEFISFEKGQPMGAKSSWAVFAIWHHMILRTVFSILGKPRKCKEPTFLIIGDDVVMLSKHAAELYRYIVKGLCGVEISPLKGFSPDTISGRNPLGEVNNLITSTAPPPRSQSVEIGKRVFLNGKEISPVSPVLFKGALTHNSNIPDFLKEAEMRESPFADAFMSLRFSPSMRKAALQLVSFPLLNPPDCVGVRLDNQRKEVIAVPYWSSKIKGRSDTGNIPWFTKYASVPIKEYAILFGEILISEISNMYNYAESCINRMRYYARSGKEFVPFRDISVYSPANSELFLRIARQSEDQLRIMIRKFLHTSRLDVQADETLIKRIIEDPHAQKIELGKLQQLVDFTEYSRQILDDPKDVANARFLESNERNNIVMKKMLVEFPRKFDEFLLNNEIVISIQKSSLS